MSLRPDRARRRRITSLASRATRLYDPRPSVRKGVAMHRFWVRRFVLGSFLVSLAVVLAAASASAGAQITVDPNAQYGARTGWVNGVGENGSQGLVMDNSAPS